jgi:hypothetical protein
VERTDLDPIAEMLIPAHLETLVHSRVFRDDHGSPPTRIEKAHYMRSVVQAMANESDRFTLHPEFSEFGRVQIEDAETGCCYLLRSDSAAAIERAKSQGVLFDSTQYLRSDVVLLVFSFHKNGLDLSVTGTQAKRGRKHLEATGEPTYMGTWRYSSDAPGFNQGDQDEFTDLNEDEDEEGGDGGDAG